MLSARGSRELRATALAMKVVARDVRSTINKGTRATMSPVWQGAVASRARTPQDRAVIGKGARIVAGNPPSAVAASSSRRLSGGLIPTVRWPAVEFGANRSKQTTYTGTSPKGKRYRITRHTTRQLPSTNRQGRVAYRAVAELGPRLAALWVQTVVRMIHEAAEKGGR